MALQYVPSRIVSIRKFMGLLGEEENDHMIKVKRRLKCRGQTGRPAGRPNLYYNNHIQPTVRIPYK